MKNIEHELSGAIMATVSLSLLGFYFSILDIVAIVNGLFVGWILRINYIKIEFRSLEDLFDLVLVVIVICSVFLGVLIGILPAAIFDEPFSSVWLYVICVISPVSIGLLRQRLKR